MSLSKSVKPIGNFLGDLFFSHLVSDFGVRVEKKRKNKIKKERKKEIERKNERQKERKKIWSSVSTRIL